VEKVPCVYTKLFLVRITELTRNRELFHFLCNIGIIKVLENNKKPMSIIDKFKTDRNYAVGVLMFGAFVVTIILTVFLLVQTVTVISSWSDGEYATNTITVNGSGEVVAVPDIATFNFSLTVTGDDVATAQGEMSEQMNKAINYLKNNGVAENDIKTTDFNANPRYNFRPCRSFNCPDNGRELVGYDVSQTVRVKVRDTEKAGELLKGVSERGITNISGLEFTIDDRSALEVEARSLAIKDAREKAEKLASDLGVKVKDVVSFGESNYGGGYYFEEVSARALDSAASAPTPEIPVGENIITSSVSVTYEIK
jgi:hypothetical protein